MMNNRRDFLKTSVLLFPGLPLLAGKSFAAQKDIGREKAWFDPGLKYVRDGIETAIKGRKNNIPPVLRDEILENPRAVFLIRTNVVSEKDGEGKFPAEKEQFERAGYETAHKIFIKGNHKGGTTYIKPNFVNGFSADERTLNNGICTHPWFVAGFCEVLMELGNTNIVVGSNGAIPHNLFVESGVCELMHNHGICFTEGSRFIYKSWNDYRESELTWVDNPEGVVMLKVPFFKLTTEKDTTFINMAKDRIHKTSMTTLTVKNLQGIMPVGYMHICQPWGGNLQNVRVQKPSKKIINPDFQREIERLYKKHACMNFKYWDEGNLVCKYFNAGGWEAYKSGSFKPPRQLFWQEQWAQRMMDVVSHCTPYINLVEGIVGIDATGTDWYEGNLYLNNFVTVSRSMVECDSVTSWLMGHDPRELPYLRIANERGLGQNDIERITIYEIKKSGIEQVKDYRSLPRARMGVKIYGLSGDHPIRFF